MDAFGKFYQSTADRLRGKINQYNEALRQDSDNLLVPVKEGLADLNEGGKLLRGVLVCLGYHMTGKNSCAYADGMAMAFEIFQTGVLIHDDIIDQAELRRGKKTIKTRMEDDLSQRGVRPLTSSDSLAHVSESAAVCAGDLLLYEANRYLIKSYAKNKNPGALLLAYDDIIINTIRGELLDVILPYELQDPSLSEEKSDELLEKSVMEIYHLKTSCYSVVGPLHMGMLLGEADPSDIRKTDDFADELGIAFQIKDDILGIYAEEGELGKDIGSDILEYKQTILYAWLKKHDPVSFHELLKYYGKPELTKKDLMAVRGIFKTSGALSYAERKMADCFEHARHKLSDMDFLRNCDRKILEDFISYLAIRKK